MTSSSNNDAADKLVLIDATVDSMLVSWVSSEDAIDKECCYELQYRCSNEEEFTVLSKTLKSCQVRKRNLQPAADDTTSNGYYFRARVRTDSTEDDTSTASSALWFSHKDPFHLTVENAAVMIQQPPIVRLGGTNFSLQIDWSATEETDGATYDIQMRENQSGLPWTTIVTEFKNQQVRKKNLTSKYGYQFRVRSSSTNDGGDDKRQEIPYSTPSEPMIALGLSAGVARFFQPLENPKTLVRNATTKVTLEDGLGGKEFILLYVSAHWCGPCRQFTPQLSQWYTNTSAATNNCCEVVFLSADHDRTGYESYMKSSMPSSWLSVDYDDDAREQLMGTLRVQGIPRLVVMDGHTGKLIMDNAVGQPLDIASWRRLASSQQ